MEKMSWQDLEKKKRKGKEKSAEKEKNGKKRGIRKLKKNKGMNGQTQKTAHPLFMYPYYIIRYRIKAIFVCRSCCGWKLRTPFHRSSPGKKTHIRSLRIG